VTVASSDWTLAKSLKGSKVFFQIQSDFLQWSERKLEFIEVNSAISRDGRIGRPPIVISPIGSDHDKVTRILYGRTTMAGKAIRCSGCSQLLATADSATGGLTIEIAEALTVEVVDQLKHLGEVTCPLCDARTSVELEDFGLAGLNPCIAESS
jgi:hypothetical protein